MFDLQKSDDVLTMSSLELLEIINNTRKEFGEPEVRNNQFITRVEDEIDDLEACQIFVSPQNKAEMKYYDLTMEQCTLVGMRESKGVRRAVLAKLKEMEAQQKFSIPTTLSGALRLASEQAELIEKQNTILTEQAPKVEFANTVMESVNEIPITTFSKTVGMGRNKMFKWLRDEGYCYKEDIYTIPYQRWADAGYFKCSTYTYIDRRSNIRTNYKTTITGKGQLYILKKLREQNLIND